jgi:hypothetical protein
MSGQLHAPATLTSKKQPQYLLKKKLDEPLDVTEKRKMSCLCWESNPESSVVHPVA